MLDKNSKPQQPKYKPPLRLLFLLQHNIGNRNDNWNEENRNPCNDIHTYKEP